MSEFPLDVSADFVSLFKVYSMSSCIGTETSRIASVADNAPNLSLELGPMTILVDLI